jgi:serine/threonine protein phosphatase 1
MNVNIAIPYLSRPRGFSGAESEWPPTEATVINLPTTLDYPIVAIADLHGQHDELARLVGALEDLPEWPGCSVVFLGDFVDRNPKVKETIDLVLELLRRPPGGSAVLGNHDLALVRAALLDGGPHSPYWVEGYRTRYDHHETFESYLGRPAMDRGDAWERDLDDLREAIPREHRAFLSSLPWLAEASGHLFLHGGLSPELGATAGEQVGALRARRWDRRLLRPVVGTATDGLWRDEYPVWVGADKKLSATPLPHPGRVQVTGHVRVAEPDVDGIRIRLDTSGGLGRLTACLLRSATAEPVFVGAGGDREGGGDAGGMFGARKVKERS